MSLLAGLETVLREHVFQGKRETRDAVLRWMKKKKQAVDAFRQLRTDYIEAHATLGDPLERDLPAPTSLDALATSIADLAGEVARQSADGRRDQPAGNDPPGSAGGDAVSGDVRVELAALRRDIVQEVRGEIMDAVKASIRDALSCFMDRLVEAEGKITALQHQNEVQTADIHALKKRLDKLESLVEDQAEKSEIERRSCNVIVEGLPLRAGENPEHEVHNLLRNTLGVAEMIEKPLKIQRLRTHTHAHQPAAG